MVTAECQIEMPRQATARRLELGCPGFVNCTPVVVKMPWRVMQVEALYRCRVACGRGRRGRRGRTWYLKSGRGSGVGHVEVRTDAVVLGTVSGFKTGYQDRCLDAYQVGYCYVY